METKDFIEQKNSEFREKIKAIKESNLGKSDKEAKLSDLIYSARTIISDVASGINVIVEEIETAQEHLED